MDAHLTNVKTAKLVQKAPSTSETPSRPEPRRGSQIAVESSFLWRKLVSVGKWSPKTLETVGGRTFGESGLACESSVADSPRLACSRRGVLCPLVLAPTEMARFQCRDGRSGAWAMVGGDSVPTLGFAVSPALRLGLRVDSALHARPTRDSPSTMR